MSVPVLMSSVPGYENIANLVLRSCGQFNSILSGGCCNSKGSCKSRDEKREDPPVGTHDGREQGKREGLREKEDRGREVDIRRRAGLVDEEGEPARVGLVSKRGWRGRDNKMQRGRNICVIDTQEESD